MDNETMTTDQRVQQAALVGDVHTVAQLLQARDRADLETAIKHVADLQNAIFEKESEREALQRELDHLSAPVRVAAKSYADALEALEQCHLDLAQLQARQACIDMGLESHRQEINELRDKLNKMMPRIIGGNYQ
jgi:chromosome segregation ATPase